MPKALVTREEFLADRQGKTFADVVNDREQPFDVVLAFFRDADRQRRMEEAELHHDRPPLAGVVRELEAEAAIDRFLAGLHVRRNTRFRQAVGVLVRMIMERRGWKKTGRKGSLGVRATGSPQTPPYNKGGLAFWFSRAERYERNEGMPYRSVRTRRLELESAAPSQSRRRERVASPKLEQSRHQQANGRKSHAAGRKPKTASHQARSAAGAHANRTAR